MDHYQYAFLAAMVAKDQAVKMEITVTVSKSRSSHAHKEPSITHQGSNPRRERTLEDAHDKENALSEDEKSNIFTKVMVVVWREMILLIE